MTLMARTAADQVAAVNRMVGEMENRVEAALAAPRVEGVPRPQPWRQEATDRPTLFRKYWADWVRSQFNTSRSTLAQREVCKQAVQRQLEEHGVRPSQIARHVDVIVAMAFVPSVYAEEAMLIENSETAELRRRAVQPVAQWTVGALWRRLVFGPAPKPVTN
jgi:hypothetical protein